MKKRASSLAKFLDRYIGIPLLYLLSIFKKKRQQPHVVKTIGILKFAGIGDTILIAHQIKQLHDRGLRVIYFCHPSLLEIAKFTCADTIVPVSFSNAWRKIQSYDIDMLIDCEVWARISAFHTFLSRAKYTIGFSTPQQFRQFCYDRAFLHSSEKHEIDNQASLFTIFNTASSIKEPLTVFQRKTKKRIVCHIVPSGAQASIRMWPQAKWISLIDQLDEYEVLCTGSTADYTIVAAICDQTKARNICGLSMKDTISLLVEAEYLVSIDTGIMHLGAALGVHTIALHGPSNPKRWGPIGPKTTIIQPNISYTPCLSLGHESTCKTNTCMQKITPSQVLQAIDNNKLVDNYLNHEKTCIPRTCSPVADTKSIFE